jgi:non-ribosomal peptide synthetase component E (peptide arylation enzyme)
MIREYPPGRRVIGDLARFAGLSVHDLLDRSTAEEPDRALVRFAEESLSYERVQVQARALAASSCPPWRRRIWVRR